jgi:DHA1 family tetracycline resistance protein-like MFS transporter
VTHNTPTASRSALLLIFAITFLNTLGMTIVFPVLPFLVQRYVGSSAAVAVWVGVLGSIYALCAFLAAPALGAISDRVGRRPILIISVLGSAVGFVVFGIGGALWVLLLGRIIDGVTGGNIATIHAYLADITPPDERGSRFGIAGAVSGAGFMLGPPIGGLLSKFGLSTPVFVAAGSALLAGLLSILLLPESLPAENRVARVSLADVHPIRKITEALRRDDLRPILLVVLAMTIPMAGLQSNLTVFALDALRWDPVTIGLFTLGVGVCDILVQGFLVRALIPRIGERGVVALGLLGQGLGYLGLAIVAAHTSAWLFVVGGLLFAASEGGTGPAIAALGSRSVSHREQGWLMGGIQSMNSAARVLGPLIAGVLYSGVGRAAPYVFGIVAVLAIGALGWRSLTATPAEVPEAA